LYSGTSNSVAWFAGVLWFSARLPKTTKLRDHGPVALYRLGNLFLRVAREPERGQDHARVLTRPERFDALQARRWPRFGLFSDLPVLTAASATGAT
jgi:hypothetical protein